MDFYEDAEDSWFLTECVKKHENLKGSVILEIGTGSGYIAYELAKKADKVYSCDINNQALKYAIAKRSRKNIYYVMADGIKWLKRVNIDLIVFNPPYLPNDSIDLNKLIDKALYGGVKGYEFSYELIQQIKQKFSNITIYFILSSLSNIDEFLTLEKNVEVLASKKLSFETLYCLKLKI